MIPDAVSAVISAVMQQHPAASPDRLARLIVDELKELGWQITAGRPTTSTRSN